MSDTKFEKEMASIWAPDLLKRLDRLVTAAEDALEYFEDRADTVDGEDGPKANEEMYLAALLRDAIDGAKR